MKPYKKLYEEEKRKNEIEQHRKKYIHIPFSWAGIGRFFLFLLSIALAVDNFFILKANWLLLNIGEVFKPDNEINKSLIGYVQLGIIPNLIVEYALIGLMMVCCVAMIKGGFDNLKSFDEGGLIRGFIEGLIGGLIIGLIGGLITGLIVGLITGLITGLIVGLIFGLIFGLIVGLIAEFE